MRSTRMRSLAIPTLAILLTVALHLNLRPWRAAGELVNEMASGPSGSASEAQIIATWERAHEPGLVLKNGVPQVYNGVGIFINGYAEFSQDVHSK